MKEEETKKKKKPLLQLALTLAFRGRWPRATETLASQNIPERAWQKSEKRACTCITTPQEEGVFVRKQRFPGLEELNFPRLRIRRKGFVHRRKNFPHHPSTYASACT